MNEVEAQESEIVTEGGNPMLEPEAEPNPLAALPEKFKSLEDMVESYSNLESKIGAKEDTFREKFIEEMEAQAYANRPETVGDYVLPESIDDELASDNALLQWWAQTAWENGYSQDEFAEGVDLFVDYIGQDIPDYDEELARLGDNASARTEAVSLFANQFFPEDVLPAIERMCESADGVVALEHMMDALKQSGPTDNIGTQAFVTEADLRQMMLDPRYHDPARRDPTFVKEVDDGFKRIFGNG
ncbi:MAG TPA: hypothetical protein DCW74_05850 [Alteromonas australica]|uniref:Uncharacterized protein n=1 Tax=Alteromonas australica TaxID=589873 RepID=A0A350P1S9_9ALTE|nr:hypothetical protein [Alteromonas australica]|tara:strand:+ start:1019 stop:1750 length:732 start_codon:yes stop_codon:yes gene_type:complete